VVGRVVSNAPRRTFAPAETAGWGQPALPLFSLRRAGPALAATDARGEKTQRGAGLGVGGVDVAEREDVLEAVFAPVVVAAAGGRDARGNDRKRTRLPDSRGGLRTVHQAGRRRDDRI